MEKVNKIKGCYNECPFFGKDSNGMYCGHPYWKISEAYDNMIITQDNSREGNIPEKCPLKTEQLTVIYRLDV